MTMMPNIKAIYPSFPNKYERALILAIAEKEILTFDTQAIFHNKLSFKRAMKNLHDRYKIVVWRHEQNGCNEYRLTNFGEHIVEILKEFL
jgi:hypothetical protein